MVWRHSVVVESEVKEATGIDAGHVAPVGVGADRGLIPDKGLTQTKRSQGQPTARRRSEGSGSPAQIYTY